MNTKFKYKDEDGSLKEANLIMAFEHNNKKYIVYDTKESRRENEDLVIIREYQLIDNIPYLYKLNNKDFRAIKKIINKQIENLESK